MIVLSGIFITLTLIALLLWASSRNYFCNGYDMTWHLLVIADVFLEAIFIKNYDHYGFYFCALAFSAVVGGYHYKQLKKACNDTHWQLEPIRTGFRIDKSDI